MFESNIRWPNWRSVIDDRDIGIARTVLKIAQRAPCLLRRQIVSGIDDVEAGLLEPGRDQHAVVDGICKRGHFWLRGVVKHQRDSFVGESGLAYQQQGCGQKRFSQIERSGHLLEPPWRFAAHPWLTEDDGSAA
jgi:hypothetical protein